MGVTIDKETRESLIKGIKEIIAKENGDDRDNAIEEYAEKVRDKILQDVLREMTIIMVDVLFSK